jgi:hypothetical protein
MNDLLGRSSPGRVRVLARAAAAVAMASAGERVCARLGCRDPRAVSIAARVLAARHVVETVILARHDTTRTRAAIGVVDALHAISMAVLAVARPDQRGPALVSGTLTTGLLVTLR